MDCRKDCEIDFLRNELRMSEKKCRQCEYEYVCPYLAMEINQVMYGQAMYGKESNSRRLIAQTYPMSV